MISRSSPVTFEQHTLHVLKQGKKERAFRTHLFESICRKDFQNIRAIIPWRDAAVLSIRSFTKLGLGTSYPNTTELRMLTIIEWILGAYMLIHFSIAVKNNLSFIVPFLGMVN